MIDSPPTASPTIDRTTGRGARVDLGGTVGSRPFGQTLRCTIGDPDRTSSGDFPNPLTLREGEGVGGVGESLNEVER